MVFISIHVNGQELHRWSPADFDLEMQPPEDPSFEARCEARKRFAHRFLDHFELTMQPMLHCIVYYDLYLVFESDAKNIPLFPHTMREFENEITNGKKKIKGA